jgi:hypothetical protein
VPLVGNGGFSLRSRKLLNAVKQIPPIPSYPEDRTICHVFGKQLEQQFGIRFAPVKIADRFSYEFRIPETTPFGFHGIEHMWRHAQPAEFAQAVAKIDVERTPPDKIINLLLNCASNGYIEALVTLYRQLTKRFGSMAIETHLRTRVGPEAAAEEMRNIERLSAA